MIALDAVIEVLAPDDNMPNATAPPLALSVSDVPALALPPVIDVPATSDVVVPDINCVKLISVPAFATMRAPAVVVPRLAAASVITIMSVPAPSVVALRLAEVLRRLRPALADVIATSPPTIATTSRVAVALPTVALPAPFRITSLPAARVPSSALAPKFTPMSVAALTFVALTASALIVTAPSVAVVFMRVADVPPSTRTAPRSAVSDVAEVTPVAAVSVRLSLARPVATLTVLEDEVTLRLLASPP